MSRSVVIDVEARFVDHLSDEAKVASTKTQKELDKVDKKEVKPLIDLENNKFLKKIRETEALMRKLGRMEGAMILRAIDKASTTIAKVINKGNEFGRKIWNAYLKVRDSDALASLKQVGRLGRELAGKTWRATVKVVDYATAPLRKLKNMLFSIQTLVGAIMAGFATKKLVIDPLGLADQYSSAKIGFSTLFGDERGQQMMNEIDQFAKATPFKTSGVITNVQKMMAYGWDAEKIISDMKVIGDAAAATGKGDQGLESIVYALSEIKSKGKLSTQELNQLASAGIKAKRYLAQGLGYGTSDEGMKKTAKAIEKGAIGANKAVELILEGMKEFDGMMDRTAKETVSGLWSTIEDTFEINIFRRWGQGLQEGAKKGLGSLVDLLDMADESLGKIGDTLFQLGKELSTWAADKLQTAVERITTAVNSSEFKNASLGGKIKILWNKVIGEPFSEWWHSEGKYQFQEIAADIGKVIAEGISNALTGIWDALPWWGKGLALLYGGSKVGGIVSGLGSLIGAGAGVIGGTGTAMMSGTGVAGGLASLGYATAGGAATSTMAGGTAALMGLGTAAGIGTGLVTLASGAVDLHNGLKNDDKATQKAGWWKIGGAGAGAATGAAIGTALGGPVIGTALGALVGSGIGWYQSNKIKDEANAATEALEKQAEAEAKAKIEMKKLVKEDMSKHFGKIALSAEEVKSTVSSMFSNELMAKVNGANDAITKMEEQWSSLEAANNKLEKTIWFKAVRKNTKLTKDDIAELNNAYNSYAETAKGFVDDSQYASQKSITVLMGNSKEAEKVIEASTTYYDKQRAELKKKTGELQKTIEEALSDNVISVNEEKSIQKIRGQIQNILAKIRKGEQEGEFNVIEAKYSSSDIDSDSFSSMMDELEKTSKSNEDAVWNEFKTASIGLKKGSKEYKALLKSTWDSIAESWATSGDFGMDKLQTKWSKELGILGQDFSVMMEKNTVPEIKEAAGKLSETTRGSISKMLEEMAPTTEEIERVVKKYEELGMKPPKALTEYLNNVEFYEALAKGKEAVEKYLSQEIDVDPKIKVVDPKITNVEALDKIFKVEANVETEWHYDKFDKEIISPDGKYSFKTEALVDAGWTYDSFKSEWISPDGKYRFTTDAAVSVEYEVNEFNKAMIAPAENYDFNVTARVHVDYEVDGSLFNGNPKMDNTAKQAQLYNSEYRGGIVGGSSSYEAFANGGMVRGGARLVKVAEEGSPEMIIPLSSQRRQRGLKLWQKAGEMMGVDGFFRGGRTDNGSEGIRSYQNDTTRPIGGRSININLGGVNFTVQADGGTLTADKIIEAVKAKGRDIAEVLAGVIADELNGQFENTPVRGGT